MNFMQRRAVFSPDRRYRYLLDRVWDDNFSARQLTYIMLNPSTADENVNDPTVERCERRARALGFGSIEVVNLFAFRATDPGQMKAAEDPIGPENDYHIRDSVGRADMVIAAWGMHGAYRNRDEDVSLLVKDIEKPLYHLGLTKSNDPKHPLYVGYDVKPQEWKQ